LGIGDAGHAALVRNAVATKPARSVGRVANILINYPLVDVQDFRHVAVVNKSVRNEMRRIGYGRVSSPHQNLDRQIAVLRAQHCHQIFREKASGKDIKNRPQLEKAIDAHGTGDVLVLAEWDRATRSMLDGVHIIERIHARGALLKVLDLCRARHKSSYADRRTMPNGLGRPHLCGTFGSR
jgi:Resolvase, N terminal domain